MRDVRRRASVHKDGSVPFAKEIQLYLTEQWAAELARRQADALPRAQLCMVQHPEHVPSAAEEVAVAATETPAMAAPAASDYHPPSALQLTLLYAYRGLLQMLRSPATLQLELLLHVFAGGVIGMAFVHDNWFLPPVDPLYVQYCPAPMQLSCAEDAVRVSVQLLPMIAAHDTLSCVS
jgi:hypothetical protein